MLNCLSRTGAHERSWRMRIPKIAWPMMSGSALLEKVQNKQTNFPEHDVGSAGWAAPAWLYGLGCWLSAARLLGLADFGNSRHLKICWSVSSIFRQNLIEICGLWLFLGDNEENCIVFLMLKMNRSCPLIEKYT